MDAIRAQRYRGNPLDGSSKSAQGRLRVGRGAAENELMKNSFFQLGAVFAILVTLSFVALEGEKVGQSMGLVEDRDPVLVFTIPHPANFAKVRAAIAPDRILWENENGVALIGERIYVTDVSHAGALISKAQWVDKPIQLVGLGMEEDDAEETGGAPPIGASPEERMAHLRSLVKKPTLTRGEQMFVLSAMNDGIQI